MKRRAETLLAVVFLCLVILSSFKGPMKESGSKQSAEPTPEISTGATLVPQEATETATTPAPHVSWTPLEPTTKPASIPTPEPTPSPAAEFDFSDVPQYSGSPYCSINGNEPFFSTSDLTTSSFEHYSDFDTLGRCGVAYACIGRDLMPTEPRGEIGMIKPSGWHTIRYDDLVEGKYLFNRCHLLGYQLTGENANTKNLITGTRYMNIRGMQPFENMVADYIQETGNHVLYRSTPIFVGDDLLSRGVLMEGLSVEDKGAGICFCIFAYNVQPYVDIDYATGESNRSADAPAEPTPAPKPAAKPTPVDKGTTGAGNASQDDSPTYVGNKNTKKFHYPTCSSVNDMKESNKVFFYGDRDELVNKGYSPCGRCHP